MVVMPSYHLIWWAYLLRGQGKKPSTPTPSQTIDARRTQVMNSNHGGLYHSTYADEPIVVLLKAQNKPFFVMGSLSVAFFKLLDKWFTKWLLTGGKFHTNTSVPTSLHSTLHNNQLHYNPAISSPTTVSNAEPHYTNPLCRIHSHTLGSNPLSPDNLPLCRHTILRRYFIH